VERGNATARITTIFMLRNDFKICDLEFVKPELNREQIVQECDARMLRKEQMPGAKNN
jgi:hypothetical protein